MAGAQMTPDSAWIIGSALTAIIATGPSYLARRAARKAESTEHAEREHTVTRDAFAEFTGKVLSRLDDQREQLNDVREWQAEHSTAHAIDKLTVPALEVRKGK